LLFLVYWFWKLYDRPSKKQLELQEEKREKRKEERMWQAIEAEMEKEREQAEALALIERKKAEMRARAQPPAAGVMQNALATLDSPTEGDEYNERFKPKISEIQEVLVDENIEQVEIDDSDVLLAPDLVEVRQDEGPSIPEITDESHMIEYGEVTGQKAIEDFESSDLGEIEFEEKDKLEKDSEINPVNWLNQEESESDSWSVSW
tara:strand:+ start:394 stop:1008 length:615 start_codon:yes stop_codon:yes gene_type:complete